MNATIQHNTSGDFTVIKKQETPATEKRLTELSGQWLRTKFSNLHNPTKEKEEKIKAIEVEYLEIAK